MATTVTIDKSYFETLLRRYVFYRSSFNAFLMNAELTLTQGRIRQSNGSLQLASDAHSLLAYLWTRLLYTVGFANCLHSQGRP